MKPPRTPAPKPTPPEPVVRDEDLDFAALMLHEGVKPVAAAGPGVGSARKATKPVVHQAAIASKVSSRPGAASPVNMVSAGPSRPVASKATASSTAPRSTARPTASQAAPRSTARPIAGQDSMARSPADGRLDELAARVTALVRERDAALAASAAAQAELAAGLKRQHVLIQERDAATLAATTLRTAASATEAGLRAELARAARRPPEPRSSLAEALLARGLTGASEQTRALGLVIAGESAARLLELLETRDPAALASVLERRLALVCGDPGCAPEMGAAALRVEPARCEVCGGSDIQRAAHGFMRACAAANIVRVRFVGGSPNYRTKLAALFPAGGSLTVHTTLGDKRVRLNKSRSQQRGDDLVIIWGATELDHATSGAYRSEYGRTEIIAHRGIGRMLELAAARIAGAPPGHSP
jgi:hypothetical protein